MVQSKPGSLKKKRKSAEVLLFPGAERTVPSPDTMLLPARGKAERAKLRIDLGALRGVLLAQQIDLLDRHEQLLEDYRHLIELYLAPHNHLALDGLSKAARVEKIVAVQKVALSRLLPAEGDTLSGAVKVLTSSLATTIQVKLKVADQARAFMRHDEDDPALREHIAELGTPALRKVHEAMALLTGHRAKAAEPPKPPPPEPIEDPAR
jgi:hypothetical protein